VDSIAKILDATNTNVVDFAKIIAQSDN
jgi:hypothetical protein